jgi:hypothetical protein
MALLIMLRKQKTAVKALENTACTLLINTLPANDYVEMFCDDLNDGSEKVNLSDYNSKLISNTTGYTFPIIQVIQLPKVNQ